MKNSEKKMLEIYESYINGNISWVKEQVKKLSVKARKDLYNFVCVCNEGRTEDELNNIQFFFELI